MKEEERRRVIFKIIRNYLANNPDKTVNVYYRFNIEHFLPLTFSSSEPMVLLEGRKLTLHLAIKNHFAVITESSPKQNAHINLSFLISEISDINEFKNLNFKVKHKFFTDKINHFASEYFHLSENRPQPLTLANITDSVVEKFKPDDEELSFTEGKEKYTLHISKERNKKVVALKKKSAFDLNPLLPCEICDISFKTKYGLVGEGFIEAHHIFPISELTEETQTKVEDLILVCSNCHKMIHRKGSLLTVEQIKSILVSNQ